MNLTKRAQLTANKKSRNSNGVRHTGVTQTAKEHTENNVVGDGVPDIIHED